MTACAASTNDGHTTRSTTTKPSDSENDLEVEVVPGRQMFTRNQLLNKHDRILDDLTPAELAAENRKQF